MTALNPQQLGFSENLTQEINSRLDDSI